MLNAQGKHFDQRALEQQGLAQHARLRIQDLEGQLIGIAKVSHRKHPARRLLGQQGRVRPARQEERRQPHVHGGTLTTIMRDAAEQNHMNINGQHTGLLTMRDRARLTEVRDRSDTIPHRQ